MKIDFNTATHPDTDPNIRTLYLNALKIESLKKAESHLQKEFGKDLRLTLYDQHVLKAIKEQWSEHIPSYYDKQHQDRYISKTGLKNNLLEDSSLETMKNFSAKYQSLHRCDIKGAFEVAIWVGNELCALSHSEHEVKSGSDTAYLNCIEGSPIKHHPLKGAVTRITGIALAHYAATHGCDTIGVIGHFSDGAHKQLSALDYTLELRDEIGLKCYFRDVKDILGISQKNTPPFFLILNT